MKIRDLINSLATAATDSSSGLTLDSEVYADHPDGGTSEDVESVYLSPGPGVPRVGLSGPEYVTTPPSFRYFKPDHVIVGPGGRIEQLEVALRDAVQLAARLLDALDTEGGIDEQSLAEKTATIGELQKTLDAR
jgi:hypothetical protein